MKEHCKKYGLDVQETVFPKGIDIFPAIVKGEVDIAASGRRRRDRQPGRRRTGLCGGRLRQGRRPARLAQRPPSEEGGRAEGQEGGRGPRRRAGAAAPRRARQGGPHLVRQGGQGRPDRLPALRRPEPGAPAEADRRHVPVGAAVVAGHQQGVRRGDAEALRHAARRAGTGAGHDREALQGEAGRGDRRFWSASWTRPAYFIQNPKVAEKYVVEQMFKGQITSRRLPGRHRQLALHLRCHRPTTSRSPPTSW